MHSQLYCTPRLATCKELKALECTESGIEGLMSTEGLCIENPEVEHTNETKKSVPMLTVNYSIRVFLCDSLCLVLYEFIISTLSAYIQVAVIIYSCDLIV